jgi:hypothetical protein
MHKTMSVYSWVIVASLVLVLTAGIASAATVTSVISYQGKLTNASGTPLTGTFSVTFRLYNVATGGTALATDTHNVAAANGQFTTYLNFPAEYYNGQALWLGIQRAPDPEKTPRTVFFPVPYALSLRPGATVSGSLSSWALKVQNNAGAGLTAVTSYNLHPGVLANTSGSNSSGVHAETHGAYSAGMSAITSGIHSSGVHTETHAGYSPGLSTITDGMYSPGVYTETHGNYAAGINPNTSGAHSSGVHAETHGNYSPGLSAITTGISSSGLHAETHGDYSPGLSAITDGRSPGVHAETHGTYSSGLSAFTNGTYSPGVYTETYGNDSVGLSAITKGIHSSGVYTETKGNYAPGINPNTSGTYSPGVHAETYGKYSPGLDALTKNTFSPGVNANTTNTSSPGIRTITYGADSPGVYAETSGDRADGVHAYSKKSVGIYAATGNATHRYGVYTPDKMSALGYDTNSGDVAEFMRVSSDVTPGTVLVIGKGGVLQPSATAYDTHVAGIVSTQPGVSLGTKEAGNPGDALIAVAGKVPCNVDASNGPIKEGDLLTTSSQQGYAMKATDPKIGTILGKAMGTLDSGTGTIDVLVMLQ